MAAAVTVHLTWTGACPSGPGQQYHVHVHTGYEPLVHVCGLWEGGLEHENWFYTKLYASTGSGYTSLPSMCWPAQAPQQDGRPSRRFGHRAYGLYELPPGTQPRARRRLCKRPADEVSAPRQLFHPSVGSCSPHPACAGCRGGRPGTWLPPGQQPRCSHPGCAGCAPARALARNVATTCSILGHLDRLTMLCTRMRHGA